MAAAILVEDLTKDYAVVGSLRPGWNQDGTTRRRCPHCGYVARSAAFTVVRERHARRTA